MRNRWYLEKIEPEIRNLVRYLRNRGVNTECSCGHQKFIQCQYIPDGSIKEIHDLLFNYFAEKREPINYTINIYHQVVDGHLFSSLEIKL